MNFVRKMTASALTYGRPPVVVDLKSMALKEPERVIGGNVEVNADGKSLEMVFKDSSNKSVFHNKSLRIHVSKNTFPTANGRLDIMWAADMLNYAIRSKRCSIVVLHNPRAVGTETPLDCMILVLEHEHMRRGISPRSIQLSEDVLGQFCDEALAAMQKRDVMNVDQKDSGGKNIFSVWANNGNENTLTGSGVEFLTVVKNKALKKKASPGGGSEQATPARNSSFFFSLVDNDAIPTSDFYVCYLCEFHDGKLHRLTMSGVLKPVGSLVQLPALVRPNTVGLLDQFDNA